MGVLRVPRPQPLDPERAARRIRPGDARSGDKAARYGRTEYDPRESGTRPVLVLAPGRREKPVRRRLPSTGRVLLIPAEQQPKPLKRAAEIAQHCQQGPAATRLGLCRRAGRIGGARGS